MDFLWYLPGILAGIILLSVPVCYCLVFRTTARKPQGPDDFELPQGDDYLPYRQQMITWMKQTRNIPHEEVSIRSFDGLTLRGKYYEYDPKAPIELMMPGYRGDAERDLCGGVQRCFALKRNALIVDQRGCGTSDGNIISFGINEHRDCLAWVDFMVEHFGPDVKIILTGISMGASTVMIAAGQPLPENVIGVIADCGFTSAKDIITKVMKQIHLPAKILYPIVKLGAKLFGGFDLDETSSLEAIRNCKIPVFFVHGEDDNFVPCEMSRRTYEACPSVKQLLIVPGAAHGVSFIVDPEGYFRALEELEKKKETLV